MQNIQTVSTRVTFPVRKNHSQSPKRESSSSTKSVLCFRKKSHSTQKTQSWKRFWLQQHVFLIEENQKNPKGDLKLNQEKVPQCPEKTQKRRTKPESSKLETFLATKTSFF